MNLFVDRLAPGGGAGEPVGAGGQATTVTEVVFTGVFHNVLEFFATNWWLGVLLLVALLVSGKGHRR